MFRIICPNCQSVAQMPKCHCGSVMEIQEYGETNSVNEIYYYFMHRIKVLKKSGKRSSLISLKGAITQSKNLSLIQKQELTKDF